MKGYAIKSEFGLTPADDVTREAWSKMKLGSLCQVEVKRPRNIRRHRLFFALCNHIADALGNVTTNEIADVLKIETGHCRILRGKKQEWRVPLSIRFDAMDEDAFRAFLDRAVQIVCEEWLQALPDSEPAREIRKMLEAA